MLIQNSSLWADESFRAIITRPKLHYQKAFIMTVFQSQIHSLLTAEIFIYTLICLFLIVWASFYLVVPQFNPRPKLSIPRDTISRQNLPTSNRRQSLGSYFDFTMSLHRVLKIVAAKSDDFDNRKELYKKRRDEFRNNPDALEELAQWKMQNHDYEYKIL